MIVDLVEQLLLARARQIVYEQKGRPPVMINRRDRGNAVACIAFAPARCFNRSRFIGAAP